MEVSLAFEITAAEQVHTMTNQIIAESVTVNYVMIDFVGGTPVIYHDTDGIDFTSEHEHLEIDIPFIRPMIVTSSSNRRFQIVYDTDTLLDGSAGKTREVIALKSSTMYPNVTWPLPERMVPKNFTTRMYDSTGGLTRLDGTVHIYFAFTFHNARIV